MPLLFSSQVEQQKQQQLQQERLQRRRASESTHLLTKSNALLSNQQATTSSKYLNFKHLNNKRNNEHQQQHSQNLVSHSLSSSFNQLLPNDAKFQFNNNNEFPNENDFHNSFDLHNNTDQKISFINNDLSQPIIKTINNSSNNNISNHGSSSSSTLNSNVNFNNLNGFSYNSNNNNNFNNNNNNINNNSNQNQSNPITNHRFSVNFSRKFSLNPFKASSTLLKTKRSGSVTTISSNRDTHSSGTTNSLNLTQSPFSTGIYSNTNNSNTITTITCLNSNINNKDLLNKDMNRNKPSNFPILQPKRKKSNSITIMDYCNILNMNTNYQMLANFYDDTEASMARLSLKTTRNANIQKQANLAEQMAALFGSSMCACYLCRMKTIDAKKAQQHNFEIVPNKHNAEYSIMKYTYSTPFSQLSCLKLFNLMNTDCSIIFSNENGNSNSNGLNSNSNGNTSILAFNQNLTSNSSVLNNNIYNINTNQALPSIGSSLLNPINPSSSSNNSNNNTNSSNSSTTNTYHFNSNSPAIYDTRYMYLIDCRVNKKKFEKSRIHTAIHYSDLLNDTLYLSPPIDNYTLIVLYDDDGTFLTSSSSPSSLSTLSSHKINNPHRSNASSLNKDNIAQLNSDEIIAQIKIKINCSPSKTFHILSGGFEQFYATFPFMCTSNLDIRSTSDRHKYLTIYPNCVIENQVYIGSGIQAKNWKIIRDLRITHIINCSIEHECVFEDQISYFQIKIEDSYQENIYKCLGKALSFMQDAFDKYYEDVRKYEDSSNFSEGKQKNASSSTSSSSNSACSMNSKNMGNTIESKASSPEPNENGRVQPPIFLIHCNLGVSRSSSVLIAYLISRYKLCLYAAFKYVKDKRLQIAPNYSFLRQLKQFEEMYDCY